MLIPSKVRALLMEPASSLYSKPGLELQVQTLCPARIKVSIHVINHGMTASQTRSSKWNILPYPAP